MKDRPHTDRTISPLLAVAILLVNTWGVLIVGATLVSPLREAVVDTIWLFGVAALALILQMILDG